MSSEEGGFGGSEGSLALGIASQFFFVSKIGLI